jgi:OOP family OmpA-OmpF porin
LVLHLETPMNLSKLKNLWALAFAGLFLAGCAQTSRVPLEPVQAAASVRASLEPLGALFEQPSSPDVSQSRLVLYRFGQDNLPGATGVFVDGTYHASIVPGAWSQLCYRPGPVNLGARQMQVGTRAKDLLDSITAMALVGGQTHYFRVMQENGYPVLKPVTQVQALRDLVGARQQMHTISRVAQDCIRGASLPLVPQVRQAPEKLTTQLMFDFDRSDLQAIVPADLMALDKQLKQWRDGPAEISTVHVMGHADPLGKPELNERLAMARAQTVREHILRQLPPGVQVSIESLGAKDPQVKHCEKSLSVRTIACNAPNRRVVVVWTVSER